MKATIRTSCLAGLLLAGVELAGGCAGGPALGSREPNGPTEPVRIVCPDGVTKAAAVQAAEFVLTRMHFPLEKVDVDQGIVRTRPLRGAQFFEFWRSDNASLSGYEEANLQSIRRTVEVYAEAKERASGGRRESADANAPTPPHSLCLRCLVSVQRLSLPANEIAGTSEGYRIHSASLPTLQRIEPTPQQRRAMAWIDLDPDPTLAARILERIEKRLGGMTNP